MNNIPPHFKKRIETGIPRDRLDMVKKMFPGIPQEQIDRARQYKIARKNFLKTLSRALSESDRRHQTALFSHQWWKVDE